LAVFDVRATNPWTVQVPENKAFAFIDEFDASLAQASGRYDSGSERGVVTVFIDHLSPADIDGQAYFFAPMSVSNQGSGVFFYLAQFKFDVQRSRVILNDSIYLGDRIKLDELNIEQGHGVVSYFEHSQGQAMAEEPKKSTAKTFDFNAQRVVEH
ncbi:hypothetical protein L4C33_21445, partial [Vibrio makurazakiensis]|uniref:hypothetical protein n=1 Tax=Vibrio makurazakiensis TaxID=2910250 RepID=UPI003D0A6FFF